MSADLCMTWLQLRRAAGDGRSVPEILAEINLDWAAVQAAFAAPARAPGDIVGFRREINGAGSRTVQVLADGTELEVAP